MNLARFARRRYTPHATPLERLEHLSRALGGPEIWIKRDDLTGLAGGGNKTRKLEFLVADALAQGCDTLVTVGAVQSNHCRLTLAAAVKEGLKCRLVLEQRVPGSYDPKASGNNFLFDLLAVEAVSVVNAGDDLSGAMQAVADELARQGRKGYVIPGGDHHRNRRPRHRRHSGDGRLEGRTLAEQWGELFWPRGPRHRPQPRTRAAAQDNGVKAHAARAHAGPAGLERLRRCCHAREGSSWLRARPSR